MLVLFIVQRPGNWLANSLTLLPGELPICQEALSQPSRSRIILIWGGIRLFPGIIFFCHMKIDLNFFNLFYFGLQNSIFQSLPLQKYDILLEVYAIITMSL